MTKYPKGSDGAAEQKANKVWKIFALAIFAVFAVSMYTGFPIGVFHENFVKTMGFWKGLGSIFYFAGAAAHFYFIDKQDEVRSGQLKWFGFGWALPILGLIIATSGGL